LNRVLAAVLGALAVACAAMPSTAAAKTLNAPIVGVANTPDGKGYWLVGADGGVFTFGDAGFFGSLAGRALNKPVVGIAGTPDGQGYWLVAADGGVFTFGDAHFYGSAGSVHLNTPVVGMARTPDGKGYWLTAADGGVFNYGDAPFKGSAGNVHLNQPVVGIAATPDGNGYWLAAADGGVFNYGDAPFKGSAGNVHLNQPVVGIAATPDGKGYWLTAADGGVFNYGDAPFHGSLAGKPLNRPVVGIARTSDGKGYWLAAGDGGVFSYGDAVFHSSLPGLGVNPAPLPAPPAPPGQVPPAAGGAPNAIPPVYVPIYQEAGYYYGVNWYLVASIHDQETDFSRSRLPGVSSGNNGVCCGGPMQFSIPPAGNTWGEYSNGFAPLAADRPAAYPLQSGVTVCLPGGGHPCVYDDFDAITAAAKFLASLGAGNDLTSAAAFHAAEAYGGTPGYPTDIAYAQAVISRAQGWQAGQAAAAPARFGATVYQDPTITVTQTNVAQAASVHSGHRRPKSRFVIHYRGKLARARQDFIRFVRAYHYARPGKSYEVVYARAQNHRRHRRSKRRH
jgi:hypothetical protein